MAEKAGSVERRAGRSPSRRAQRSDFTLSQLNRAVIRLPPHAQEPLDDRVDVETRASHLRFVSRASLPFQTKSRVASALARTRLGRFPRDNCVSPPTRKYARTAPASSDPTRTRARGASLLAAARSDRRPRLARCVGKNHTAQRVTNFMRGSRYGRKDRTRDEISKTCRPKFCNRPKAPPRRDDPRRVLARRPLLPAVGASRARPEGTNGARGAVATCPATMCSWRWRSRARPVRIPAPLRAFSKDAPLFAAVIATGAASFPPYSDPTARCFYPQDARYASSSSVSAAATRRRSRTSARIARGPG